MKLFDRAGQSVRPWLLMGQLRLPLVVLPVLASFRRLSFEGATAAGRMTFLEEMGVPVWALQCALLFTIPVVTGCLQMSFSVTWGLVLFAAFTLETELLLGVGTVLSLSVFLGWYVSLFRYPHSICALWGGTRGYGNVKGEDAMGIMSLGCWQAWDLLVHALPAFLMLLWHGPGITMRGMPYTGTVTPAAVAMALPLNLLWLWGIGLSLGKPLGVRLADTNAAYAISPALPKKAWKWVHASHWVVCLLWVSMLVVPSRYSSTVGFFFGLVLWHLFAATNLRDDLLVGRTTFFMATHLLAVIGAYRATVHPSAAKLWVEAVLGWMIGGFGITCGAHRLWSHRSYTAKTPFRIFLMLLNSFANQGTIYHWARDHRAHHKYTDTPADPHDTNRGFFFAHIGWLLVPKHPDIKAKGDTIPCHDLKADPVVMFQERAERMFMWNEIVSFLLPAFYGKYVYGDFWLGFFVHGMLRWILCLNATWCVNSVAHFFGDNKYDPAASAKESWTTTILAVGEGWHSYHHKYPYDYATSEFGADSQWNPSKILIDIAAMLGQASNLKRADKIARKDLAKRAETKADHAKEEDAKEDPSQVADKIDKVKGA
mmetsp:Transcript_133432/g.217258  ORF Transcript_133432/g.217258 Transcript_133432/m.217258 type:complete len:598 (+) Transcript_133432:86-1879(+)